MFFFKNIGMFFRISENGGALALENCLAILKALSGPKAHPPKVWFGRVIIPGGTQPFEKSGLGKKKGSLLPENPVFRTHLSKSEEVSVNFSI